MKKPSINIIGEIFGITGYDSHTRSLANALSKLTDCKISTKLPQNWERLVNDAEFKMIMNKDERYDYNLIISTPHNWRLYTGLGKNIGYCVWEGDKVPESWIDDMLNPDIDLIFVPSEHTKQAIWNTYWKGSNYEYMNKKVLKNKPDKEFWNKIKIIPHGVNTNLFYECKVKEKDKPFRFICNKGWRGTSWDRGGVQYLIQAFSEEFTKEEKIELAIKLNPAYMNPAILQQSIDALQLPIDRPPINIILNNIPFNELVHLYNKADCFITPTRCESFGLPGLEAMACGLPVVLTNYGGQTDYMTKKNSLFIDYKLEEVKEDMMYEGIQWATPNKEDLKKKLRWAFNNQKKIKEMGQQALKDSKKWTWDISAKKIMKLLSQSGGSKGLTNP